MSKKNSFLCNYWKLLRFTIKIVKFFYFFHILRIEVIDLNNMNFDENTVNKLKDMMNNGELNDVISQIPPEMIQNFYDVSRQRKSNKYE